MKTRFRILFAFMVIAIVGGIAWQVLRPREQEPVYQGQPLSVWLEGYLSKFKWNGPERQKADEAMRQIGTNALPTLLRLIKANDSASVRELYRLAQKQHVIR